MSRYGTSISYTYNEDGLRVGKNVNGTTTSYVLHGKNVVHLTQGSNNLHFFYAADGSPAIVEYNGVSYGYVKNLQGDIIGIVNASGAYVVRYAYDAWGKQLSKTGSMADTLGTLNPFRYRGYVYDEETGLYYLRSRYYNPIWDRFLCADAKLGRNLFAYCISNPISLFDEDGQSPNNYLHMVEMTNLHEAVVAFVARSVGGVTMRKFTRIYGAGRSGGDGFPDVMKKPFVWEIKPLTAYGKTSGPKQMKKYTNNTGYYPGYAVPEQGFPWTLNGKKGFVYIINGCAITNDAGVVYYKFVPFKEEQLQEEPAPVTVPAFVPAQTHAYSGSSSQSDLSGLGICTCALLFLISLVNPLPGDEFAAGTALLMAIP